MVWRPHVSPSLTTSGLVQGSWPNCAAIEREVSFTFRQERTTVCAMKVLTYDRLVRDFPKAWATIETNGEEVVVTRERRRVARIVPEPRPADALEVFGDVYGGLGERAGAALADTLATARKRELRHQTLQELRNPWDS